ncbi:glycosyltransferase family 2 protein [Salipiger profundus]|uniref:Glycosyl transferase family 2 n=2 Tax=Salipiger TaxID=263377 RepID=A0A1U7DDZ3_9RHOB|nr:glycosyltransferase family 2 protein [Salipiger profundus]APX26359.1 Glycosyl transferase family 2 [Salipiger profundus]GGA21930.1 hypothetical protein GCM10011326_38140 [Salipiger profundus]
MPQTPAEEQIALLRRADVVNTAWYLTRYPDVQLAGMDPVAHYVRYGAEMGRDPGPNFRTDWYLEHNPEAAESDLNPLLHYVLYGQPQGLQAAPPDAAAGRRRALRRIEILTGRLTTLGVTVPPLNELAWLARTAPDPVVRATAGAEVALWHLREGGEPALRSAQASIARAQAEPGLPDALAGRLTLMEMLALHALSGLEPGARDRARAILERAQAGNRLSADLLLAWANLQDDPGERLFWVNQALAEAGIPPLALREGEGALYDRLTSAVPLPPVEEGPKVSVLLAAHDAARTLPTALRALAEQTWRNLEILVIDDASRDDTAAIAEAAAEADPRIRVLRLEANVGAYRARNAGLEAATGDYVTVHDADDWTHPERIERQVRLLEARPELVGCLSQMVRGGEDLRITRLRANGRLALYNMASFLFRRAPVRERLGCWDTVRFGADSELVRRCRKVFGAAAVAEMETGPLTIQRDGGDAITENPVTGIQGFYYGARFEYFDAQGHHHRSGGALRYTGDPDARPFAVPALMTDPDRLEAGIFDAIYVGDFRLETPELQAMLAEIAARRARGERVGIVPYYDVELDTGRLELCDSLRAQVDGETLVVLVYGNSAACRELIGPDITDRQLRQRYTPEVTLLG